MNIFEPPDGLEERGLAFWDALTARVLPPAALVLAAEACRMADRLERLDAILRSEVTEWARIQIPDRDSDDMALVIDAGLSEARQQAGMLRQLLTSIEAMAPKESDEPGDALGELLNSLSSPLRN